MPLGAAGRGGSERRVRKLERYRSKKSHGILLHNATLTGNTGLQGQSQNGLELFQEEQINPKANFNRKYLLANKILYF